MAEVTYSQDEVDELKRQWELAAFEVKTKEVLAQINRRLDESNNYKATIGRDVKLALSRLDQMDADRKKAEEVSITRHEWVKDWWVRLGILGAVVYEAVSMAHTLGLIK